MISYCEVINYILRKKAKDDIFLQADTEIWKYSQLDNQTAKKLQKALWRKASRYGSVYYDLELNNFSTRGSKVPSKPVYAVGRPI